MYRVLNDSAEELPHALEVLRESEVDALLLVNFISQELVSGLMEMGLPAVMVDHYFPNMPLDSVMNENFNAAIRAVQHLIEMGHAQIGFLDGPPHYTIERRREGYRAALERAGIGYNPDLVLPGTLHMSSGIAAAEEHIRRKLNCTAYFCANDTSAIGLIQGLRRHNIRVPEDVSVIGFDDIEAAKLITPALTTIQSNAADLGRLAVIRLLERVKDTTLPITQTLLQSSLILRNSVMRL
jgi:LacI family transcriptional regulator